MVPDPSGENLGAKSGYAIIGRVAQFLHSVKRGSTVSEVMENWGESSTRRKNIQ